MRAKQLCKFKENCKNFKTGQDCPFSHDKCRDGDQCPNKQNCMFYHESSSSIRKDFKQPINEVQCKFGPRCNKLAEGKCPFKHSQSGGARQQSFQKVSDMQCKFGSKCNKLAEGKCNYKHSSSPQQRPNKTFNVPKSQQYCKFKQRCNLYAMGKCQFKHSQSIVGSLQQNKSSSSNRQQGNSESFKQILASICCQFAHNRQQSQQCGKLHEYTLNKTIRKIYQVDNSKIIKATVYQYRNQDQQPIYAILIDGKIVFGQLINLAKESGMQHINNNSMVFKRCYDKDIALQNQAIEDFYLTYSLSQDYARVDILVIKGSKNTHVSIINKGTIQSYQITKNILGVLFIGNFLLIQFIDHNKLFLKFNPISVLFEQANNPLAHKFSKTGRCSAKLYGSQIAYGILDDNSSVCFINQSWQAQIVRVQEKVKDLILIEYDGSPLALVLTQKQLIAINLLTFQKKSILEAQLAHDLEFASLNYTLGHLFLTIDGWGIMIYNINSLQSPSGVLCLGERQWKIQSDDRGNLSLVSIESTGYTSWWIFKIRRH